MGNTINEVGSWLNANVWRPVEIGLFNFQESVDRYAGRVVNWNPAEITTSDRAAATLTLFAAASPYACEPQEESSKSIGEDVVGSQDVAAEVSQKPSGIVFCAKTGVVEADDDCHLDKNIKDKMSSCVYLTSQYTSVPVDSCSSSWAKFFADYDQLMLFLLGDKYPCFRASFDGNNDWPTWFLYNDILFKSSLAGAIANKLIDPLQFKGQWESLESLDNHDYYGNVKIFADEATWSTQVWFRQSPDLCWAVYETPCADESVCE